MERWRVSLDDAPPLPPPDRSNDFLEVTPCESPLFRHGNFPSPWRRLRGGQHFHCQLLAPQFSAFDVRQLESKDPATGQRFLGCEEVLAAIDGRSSLTAPGFEGEVVPLSRLFQFFLVEADSWILHLAIFHDLPAEIQPAVPVVGQVLRPGGQRTLTGEGDWVRWDHVMRGGVITVESRKA